MSEEEKKEENKEELLKQISKELYKDEWFIEKAILSYKNQQEKTYTFYKDNSEEKILQKYNWCQRPCDTNMSLCRFVINGEVEGFMSESLVSHFDYIEQIDLNEFIHHFVKPLIKENIELKKDKKALVDNYNKVLNQRNRLLKEISFNPSAEETLDVWDEQLVLYGKEIIKKREEFIKQISKIIKPIHEDLTNKEEVIKIDYHKNTEVKDFEKNLKRNRSVDLRNKSTSVGPHRDDILFFNKDINIRTYGSQGQKRTIALSLKLAEIELVKKIINDTPVLLLDDVLSELDSERQNHLLERLDNIQTIVTCTGLDEFVENSINIDRVFKVDNAKVKEKKIN